MELNKYQAEAAKTDLFEFTNLKDPGFTEKILGLCGETGEVADKFKKILRDEDGIPSDASRDGIKKELGDVLWYIAAISRYMNIPLEDIAKANLDKLAARKEQGKLHGSGDNR